MSDSLKDQLLKLGLVTEKQAKKATPPSRRASRHVPPPPPPAEVRAVQQAQAAKLARDQELNRQRQAQADAKAKFAQIRQIIEQDRIAKPASDDTFNFVYAGKIRRIPINDELRGRLNRGEVFIARCEGRYDYVPAATAERLRKLDERIVMNPGAGDATAPAEDDPYKDFVVPDDLVW